ncbi:Zn(2)-C6 fungal-type DNA-binding domain containing protein [Parasponia andersonii]|uniref:Zn(2)-C6 fungal-type DNA-binding domain containing protein n=1 Tax=Parasponia andersonii TaxID=3476 RepID=A0A2P5B0T7_PARAD|nr:Zn(2)-C6 fungal-type DNA-binding domain containing protein [Parasponia andersonii]
MELTGQVPLPRSRVHQPCAACRMLRRKCDRNCVLSPYFPSDEIEKFVGVHKVFGASNVIKMIQDTVVLISSYINLNTYDQMVEEEKRDDTVQAIVYEAKARLRDPIYGSAGTIFHLQRMVNELRSQLESTTAQVMELQEQRDRLLGILMNVHYLEFDTLPTMQHVDPLFYGSNSIHDIDPPVSFFL